MSRIALLDGGMGQELIARSSHPLHPLWSAFVMLQSPEIVREVHVDYIAAGARVITINAYACTGPRLRRDGYPDDFDALQAAACRLAEEAREAAEVEGVAIAGCLPPLWASYRPDLTPEDAAGLAEYRRIVEAQAPHVDLFLCETMTSGREARLAATAALEAGKPVWTAITLRDGGDPHLRSGETVRQAFAELEGLGIAALVANCCYPESIDAALPELAGQGLPWGAYANGFTGIEALAPGGTVAGLRARSDLGPEAYARFMAGWAGQGATVLGGCCEVGPAHIRASAEALAAAGHEIVGAFDVAA